jgi:hypothetical protein
MCPEVPSLVFSVSLVRSAVATVALQRIAHAVTNSKPDDPVEHEQADQQEEVFDEDQVLPVLSIQLLG